MLFMYIAQQCFGFSYEAIEHPLYDSQVIRRFVGMDLGGESARDSTSLLKFRRLLEKHKVTANIFETIKKHLASKGLMMRPAHHRLPDWIRAHALVCFITLALQHLIFTRLRAKSVQNVISPERALAILRRIQTHRVFIPDNLTVTGISTIDAEQSAIFDSLRVKKPTVTDRYASL